MTMMVESLAQQSGSRDGVGDMYTVATLGSHSALQILKGAHDEGFNTLAIANQETTRLYQSFAFIDEVITIELRSVHHHHHRIATWNAGLQRNVSTARVRTSGGTS